jgi:acetyltransferase
MEGAQWYRQRGAPPRPSRPASATLQVADGRRVRAIGPQVAKAEQHFSSALSPRSRYRRFLLSARSLSEPTLHALTAVDQHRHVALIALADGLEPGNVDPRIVADARYVWENKGCSAEFAIAVADDWQRQGLGVLLMRQLAELACLAGVRQLFGYVLTDNLPMQALVRVLGGRVVAHPENEELRLARLDLTPSRLGVEVANRDLDATYCPS